MVTTSIVFVELAGLMYPPPHTARVGEEQPPNPLLAINKSPKSLLSPVVAKVT